MEPITESIYRVVVVEDDHATRTFFEECAANHPRLKLAASFGKLAPAKAWFRSHSADVLLTDLSLPDGHALTWIRELSVTQPGCEIVVVSMFGDEDTVIACVEAGAVGYVHKDSASWDVAKTILDVKAGASPISPMIARKLLSRMRKSSGAVVSDASIVLSERESQVLDLIARGYSYSEIAKLADVSINTVQSHIKTLYSKLAVHSRGEAVFEASRLGLLPSMRPGR